MRARCLLSGMALQCLLLCVASTALSVSEIQATGKVLFRALRDSECKVKCKSRKPRIMCGSDGVSYLSKCEIKRARRCEGKNVTIKRKGKCSEKDVPMTKCLQERDEALTASSAAGKIDFDVFIPDCSADGTFADVQCHRASGYCWCVSKEGKPFSGTSVLGYRPNCMGEPGKPVKSNRPPKISSKSLQRRKSTRRKRGSRCSDSERRKFNSNLVRVFTEEYNRSMSSSPARAKRRTSILPLDKQVMEWKFSQYDKNTDNSLQRREVNGLRRLVKKFIKPRACAKRFLKFCDKDRNKLIARREWSVCLGVAQDNNDRTTQAPPEVTSTDEGIARFYHNEKASPSSSSGSKEVRHNLSGTANGPTAWQDFTRPRPASKPNQDKKPKTCVVEQESALQQEAENPDAGIFIPNCTPDGKWAPAQCHRSTGYCWCVDEMNGRPISGTSTHDVMPSCDFETERRIEDCAHAEKQTFLSDLMTVLTAEMAEYAINGTEIRNFPMPSPDQTLQERAVHWRFTSLDTNHNMVLDKDEWDQFKSSLKASRRKYTRKCARKFVRYCDENDNKRISLEEWVDCMGIKKNVNTKIPANPKRTGKNPFDRYLRDT